MEVTTPAISSEVLNTIPVDRVNSDGVEIVAKKRDSRNIIADAAKEFLKNDGVDNLAEEKTSSNVVEEPKKKIDQGQNFKNLREALDIANRKVADFESKLEKVKDYDVVKSKAEQLEKEIGELKPRYEEMETWRAKNNILRSEDFHKEIVEPRKQIAAAIKAELKADGLNEDIWEKAQIVNTRRELEELVNNEIDSDLLKQQFYKLYFDDLALRQKEQAALAAPIEYLERVKAEEAHKRYQQRQEQERVYGDIWKEALQDADDMNDKLGENKIVEISFLDGNKEHNEKVVTPILKIAHQGAEAELKERIELGLPVTRDIASKVVYKWRQALAAQAANRDRLRWYKETLTLKNELKSLQEKYDRLLAKASPTPGANNGSSSGGMVRGGSTQERLRNLMNEVKNG